MEWDYAIRHQDKQGYVHITRSDPAHLETNIRRILEREERIIKVNFTHGV